MSARRPRIAIAGAGVAGAILARGLSRLDVEVLAFERVAEGEHAQAGTGLNVGPNAVKSLRAFFPDLAEGVEAASLPWRRWFVELADGTRLIDLDLAEIADNPGIRIRWSELYRALRAPLGGLVRYRSSVTAAALRPDGRLALDVETAGGRATVPDIDLLIAGDGRFSRFRETVRGPETPRQLGIAIFRVLVDAGEACPIDDYGQWFNGPNRLLAFRIPGDKVYIAGAFPIPKDADIPAEAKRAGALERAFLPASGPPGAAVDWMVRRIAADTGAIHWARIQEGAVAYARPGLPVLLVGDAAHPMVPTLGQGATQAVEDACAVYALCRRWLAAGRPLGDFPLAVAEERGPRARFVVDFSREATDTMLPGADPVGDTLKKAEPPFLERLGLLYRQSPMPV